ncbi:AraC family transcriptional regulator [Paenibacillus sacheonensis]|uniref:Helix-turn-helix domain-containing protein n=1 Tax=Paenibacillus sacheonensis TaxID=742054 RepID=A0A7X4YLD9_9BACL|nr:AraC family transcriptional regulator [Paenibacillus sacheonensis]MBM7568314.1 AraC-like DNA-binding protein [Paenibacillus sacheonensis]NBC68501.1 helix-turn-helix domain-containing protein [Paenibacillus sacheonensis]
MGNSIFNPDRLYNGSSDLQLLYWGKESCAPGHSVGPGIRECWKVHFIHDGFGHVTVGDYTYRLSAGEGFIVYPQVVTHYEADTDEPWTYSWVAFQGAQLREILAGTSLSPEHPVFPMDLRTMPGLYDALNEAVSHGGAAGLRLTALLYEFMFALTEAAPASSATPAARKQDGYVHRSIGFIQTHFCENISVGQLAAHIGLDRKYFSVLFKEALGMPPQRYLLHYRMDKACELLESGAYTVGEVARSVGYQDALLFSKMFKKVKGASPKRFIPAGIKPDFVT